MKKLMRLDEAIEKKIINNLDKVNLNMLFPLKSKVKLTYETTGRRKPQYVSRQGIKFVFFNEMFECEEKFTVIGMRKSSKQNVGVSLRGRIACNRFYYCFEHLCKGIFSNSKKGIKASAINEEDLIKILQNNTAFRGWEYPTWIGASYDKESKVLNYEAGVKTVKGLFIFNQKLTDNLGRPVPQTFDFCPQIDIFAPSKVLVVLKSKSKSGEWKLIPRKGLVKWLYK